VLVVDDAGQVRTMIRRALAGHGYQVDVAASLAEARALGPTGYDAVLVDVNLGAERGTDLIAAMLAEDPAAARRCLVVTGGGQAGVPPGVARLAKPFRPDELVRAVRALHPPAAVPGPPAVVSGAPSPASATPRPAAGSAAGNGGHPARLPAAWRLLGMIRGLRAAEHALLGDFLHDGPIQELTAATLELHIGLRQAPGDLAESLDELQQRLDETGRSLRLLTDGNWAAALSGGPLADVIRRRVAWLPLSSVDVDVRHTCAALRAEAPLLADVVELALFLMSASPAAAAPAGALGEAHVCVQAGEDEAEIVLTLTGTGEQAAGGDGRAGDEPPGGPGARAAAEDPLAELAALLGGTVHAEAGPGRWQVRITLPRQLAASGGRT